MRVTIIREDGQVYVDGQPRTVDTTSLEPTIHAIQWDGTAGEIEFAGVTSRKPNEVITDFGPYEKFVAAWNAAGKE